MPPTADLQLSEDAIKSNEAICERRASGKADDGSTVAGKGVRKLIGFFNGVRSQEIKEAFDEVPGSAQNVVHEFHDLDVNGNVMKRTVVTAGAACDELNGDYSAAHVRVRDNMADGYDSHDGSDHGAHYEFNQSAGFGWQSASESEATCASEVTEEKDGQALADVPQQESGAAAGGPNQGQFKRDEPIVDEEAANGGPNWRTLAQRAGARTAERAEIVAQQLADKFAKLKVGRASPPDWLPQLMDQLNSFLAWIEYCGQHEKCAFEDFLRWRPPLRPRKRRGRR